MSDERHWSILTKTRGGVVSILRDLTEGEARRLHERLDPWYGRTSEQFSVHADYLRGDWVGGTSSFDGRICQDSDVDLIEVFGPPGWKNDFRSEWPKIITIWTDDNGCILPDEQQEHPGYASIYRRMRADRDADDKPALPDVERSTAPPRRPQDVPEAMGAVSTGWSWRRWLGRVARG